MRTTLNTNLVQNLHEITDHEINRFIEGDLKWFLGHRGSYHCCKMVSRWRTINTTINISSTIAVA